MTDELPELPADAHFNSLREPSSSPLRYTILVVLFLLVLSVVGVGAYLIDSENKQNDSLVQGLLTPTPDVPRRQVSLKPKSSKTVTATDAAHIATPSAEPASASGSVNNSF